MSSGEESISLQEDSFDLSRSGRKRKKVNYSNSGAAKYKKGAMKDQDVRRPRGTVPRGNEIPRSPMSGRAQQGEEEANMSNSSTSTASTTVGAPHTLDSLAGMISTVVSQNHIIVQKFDGVEERLAQNALDIRKLDERFDKAESEFASRVDAILDSRLGGVQGVSPGSGVSSQPLRPTSPKTSKQARETDAYWTARRSLRIAPVPNRDLKNGAIGFVEEHLDADASILHALPPSAFRRPPSNRNSAIREEIIVCFKTLGDRDYIKSLAYKLAGKKDHVVRLELPSHLLGQHRVLGKAGQELRAGLSGSKTIIRFDDDNLRLVMDYKTKDGPWKRLCPDQASAAVGTGTEERQTVETSATDFQALLRPASGANAQPLGE